MILPALTNRELPRYHSSLCEWIRDVAAGKQKPGGFARDISRAYEATVNDFLDETELFVPLANLRGLSAGVQGSGGYLVPTDTTEIIQALRPFSATVAAGAVVEEVSGNLAVPREVTAPSATWLAEADTITEATQLLGQATAVVHRVGCLLSFTRQLRAQSDVETFVIQTGLKSVAQAIDRGALVGSNVFGEPAGIYSMAGVQTVVFSAAATWANALTFIANAANQNAADENIAWIGHPNTRQKWMNVQKFSGSSTPLWDTDETIAGKRAYVTTNIGSTSICCGDFSQMRIIMFGPARIVVDPFSQTARRAERVEVTVHQSVDVITPFPAVFTINSGSAIQ